MTILKESKLAGGRIGVYIPNHPAANNRGYILKYRFIMEQHLGRYLNEEEVVHHIDGDESNNDLGNLELLCKVKHAKLHNNLGASRQLDYEKIEEFRRQGFGYKRISKLTGYPLSSVKSAVKKIVTGSYR